MSLINLLFILSCLVAVSTSCGSDKKEEPKIHIIHVKSNKQLDEPDIVEVHLPEISSRRRRELKVDEKSLKCLTNKDCLSKNICDEKLKKCRTRSEDNKKVIQTHVKNNALAPPNKS